MGIEFGNTPNTSQQYAYAEDMAAKPQATTDGYASVSSRDAVVDNPLSSFAKGITVRNSGEITQISPHVLDPESIHEGEVIIKLDNGLNATVDKDGAKFEQIHTSTGPNGQEKLVITSVPIGELDFSELEKSSIGAGGGGIASLFSKPDGAVDSKTQNAAVALYDGLQNVDKSELSYAQRENVDKVLDQLRPFIAISARGDSLGGIDELNSIETGDQGGVELQYRGLSATKDVVVKGDMLSVEYQKISMQMVPFANAGTREPGYSMPNLIENIKVEMDLSKIDQWTPEQNREAGALKGALENVDKDTLTADELKAHDKLMMKLDDVSATQTFVSIEKRMDQQDVDWASFL